jgi:hypothetical protein
MFLSRHIAAAGAWLCAGFALAPGWAAAQKETTMQDAVFSPRVVGERRADFYSLETLLASPPFAGQQGEALALAIYDYFTSTADGTWHGWPADEREGQPVGWGKVSDPVKLLNAYGWMICGQCADVLLGLYRAAGMPARIFGVPGHNLCEVFYDGRWHVLDVDMWTWFRTPDGHIASACELAQDARRLILQNTDKSNPCDLPDRKLEDYAQMYEQAKATVSGDRLTTVFPHWATRAHTMDFALRPGETLIRSQSHAGRFHMPQSWQESMTKYKGEWPGRPRERYAPFRTVGNGRWLYAPDLTAKTRDFELGVRSRQGLTQDERGLVGPGTVVFRIQSPYPFCGVPEWRKTPYTYSNGVWLALAGNGPFEAEVTDPEGRFVAVSTASGAFADRPDITALLEARYDALLRITLGAGARLDKFAFGGYIMTAPLTLPRLAEGRNRMELRCRDKHQKRTTPWTVPVDFRSETALRAVLAGLENATIAAGGHERLCIQPTNGAARALFRFDAPETKRFAWAYAIATVPEGPTNAPARRAALEWSADGAAWKPLAQLAIPNTPHQWDASIDGEIVPAEPSAKLWLRATSETGITAFEFTGHIEQPALPGELRITHRWKEGDAERSFVAPRGATVYELLCGKDPEAHTIEMSVPSVTR